MGFLFYNLGEDVSTVYGMDNFQAIPEPSATTLLIGGGLVLMLGWRRRVRRNA